MKSPIFLSASIPSREPYMHHYDAVAIRESILALVAVTVRERRLVFGGHPAISPLVEHAARSLGAIDQVHIYQSKFFEDKIPAAAKRFPNLHWTERDSNDLTGSLKVMRIEMISSQKFSAAVFIGGMEGIFEEFRLFKKTHPGRTIIPVASTGGAAKNLFEQENGPFTETVRHSLQLENRYRRLFKSLLPSE